MAPKTHTSRQEGYDLLRGLLLVAMLAVHVVAAHATATQAGAMHAWLGIFLISSGFVALSGYMTGMKPVPLTREGLAAGAESAVRLWLLMFAFAVLASLLKHGFAVAAGGTEACWARAGWLPPRQLESLGILLPIGLVQLLGPLARLPGRKGPLLVFALAVGFMLLPAALAGVGPDSPLSGVADVLFRRTLTPYYTVTTFVAVGLVAAGVARLGVLRSPRSGVLRLLLVLGAVLLAVPVWSQALLDRGYLLGVGVGALLTLAYWSLIACLLLSAFARADTARPALLAKPAKALVLLGRSSLLVFLLHVLLLELDHFLRALVGLPKGLLVAFLLVALDLAVMVLAAAWVRRSAGAGEISGRLLLSPRAGRGGALGLAGALTLVGILGTYSGVALAGPRGDLRVDDFEAGEACPGWWTFGELQLARRLDGERGSHVLQVRGAAPGMFAHGLGLYLAREVGELRTLQLEVRGYGPGSGRLKIELLEDDNGNWEIEKVPPLHVPAHDDRFVLELAVDWQGWRRLTLPVSQFRDDNPAGGNGRFDPARDLTSGGLLEMQLLFAPAGPGRDEVQLDIDDVRWTP